MGGNFTSVKNLWYRISNSLWFVPACMMLGAALLSAVTITIDYTMDKETVGAWLLRDFNNPDAGRALLSIIAGSMITVAGVVFSITTLVLTLASQQFGPRVLRNYLADRGNQAVLGTFISTYLYSLLVVFTISKQFVPQLSIVVAIVLGISSLVVLIYYINHVASIIQAAEVINAVSDDFQSGIERITRDMDEEAGIEDDESEDDESEDDESEDNGTFPMEIFERAHTEGHKITSEQFGYLQVIELEKLIEIASEHHTTIVFEFKPGDFITRNQELVKLYPIPEKSEEISSQINKCFLVGPSRTTEQDIVLPAMQLIQIALRGLSPALNDPYTAIICIDNLGAGLSMLADRRDSPRVFRDEYDLVRVIRPQNSFEEIMDIIFDDLRRYSIQQPTVLLHQLRVLRRLLTNTSNAKNRRCI